ncbi:MAG: hypothetical protein QM724_09840 [Flavobacteriales bacterium]
MMRPFLSAILFTGLAATALAQDRNYSDCVVKANSSWGKPCEKCEAYTEGYKRDFRGVYQVELQNTCSEAVEVKVAMQEAPGTWRTFPAKMLGAGQSMTAFACNGTGKYLYWVRRLNDTEIALPSDAEILTEYRGR